MEIGSEARQKGQPHKRRQRPYKPGSSRLSAAVEQEQVHDRIATDIPIGVVGHIQAVEIDDPFSEPGKRGRIVAAQSLKTDPLAWMRAHHRIDEACYLAGRQWQRIYARANIGSIGSIDTTKEAVSGGRFPEPITDSHIDAFNQLREINKALKTEDNQRLIHDILGREIFPRQAAEERGDYTDWAIRKWAKRFYRALNLLAIHFNLASPKSKSQKRQENT